MVAPWASETARSRQWPNGDRPLDDGSVSTDPRMNWTSCELFRTRRRADSRVGGSLSDLRGKGNAARGIRFMSLSYILGISAYYHDSAACLIGDGDIIAAASEERFTRKKGDPAFPTRAVEYCL